MINWKEIKDRYLKAFKLLQMHKEIPLAINKHNELGWYFDDGVHSVKMWKVYTMRDLYDFFDENEIYISTIHRDSLNSIPPYQWKIMGDISEGYKTRLEAEEAAFTKAFELLNNKLL